MCESALCMHASRRSVSLCARCAVLCGDDNDDDSRKTHNSTASDTERRAGEGVFFDVDEDA